jgi:hypothetical protein
MFPLFVIAFIVLRIVSAVLRRRRRDQSAGAAPSKAARGFAPWAEESQGKAPMVRAVPDEDEDFSAWNLSVEDDPPPAPSRTAELPGPEPLPANRSRLPEMPGAGPAPGTGPALSGLSRLSETPEPAQSGLSRFPETPETDPPGAVRSARIRPEQRLRRLSPLQRGLVWAELLGPPKGLEG